MPDRWKVRILLADEQWLFRDAVRAALRSEPDVEVIAEASDGLEAVREAERTTPDVAMLDADLPNCNGVRAARLISERVGTCRVLVLSADADLQHMVEAFDAGAHGYLTKKTALTELIGAARALHRGETVVPPDMLQPLLAHLMRRRGEADDARRRLAGLTRREREVLTLLGEGGGKDAIAQRLVISPETARTHVQHILGKLGVHSRLEAAAFVRRNGILEDLVGAAR